MTFINAEAGMSGGISTTIGCGEHRQGGMAARVGWPCRVQACPSTLFKLCVVTAAGEGAPAEVSRPKIYGITCFFSRHSKAAASALVRSAS
ncbi:hypothetical protein, partial [uncultured Hyphomicrobium sp.]|uniref:hypothetical protein n=1 Tax=uncultured Hyphomicrobium sp. TaxID=194373 RepID=UPI0025DB176E